VPLFNRHQDALLRADTELQIALNDVRGIATDVDNSVRLSYAKVDNARARIAEYQDVMVPQRIETVASAQQEVNYMLIGIFELIALKQDEYDAYQGYLEAIRDYWLARAELGLATGTALPSNSQIGEQRVDVDQFTRPASGGMDHSAHSGMSHEMDNGGSK
jgi:outer membrane protein, heavy metal efflux system